MFIYFFKSTSVCFKTVFFSFSVAARSKRAPPGLSVTAESANQTTNINFNLDAIILAPPPGMDSLSYYPSMDSRQMAAKMNAGDQ
jgi:hypothetical protein